MVVTMTTSRVTIHREEVVRDWPIFVGDSDIPASVGVISVEVQRRVDESVTAATMMAAATLAAAVSEMLPLRQGRLWLVALGRPTLRSSRVAAYNTDRDKLWSALEKSGVTLPSGVRTESQIAHSDDILQFWGAIEFPAPELPVALEVTRHENAICVGQTSQSNDANWERFISSVPLPQDSTMLLHGVLRQMSGGLFAARSFGQFDDTLVAAEIFAEDDILNRLQSILLRLE
jgi:hypothetical protein